MPVDPSVSSHSVVTKISFKRRKRLACRATLTQSRTPPKLGRQLLVVHLAPTHLSHRSVRRVSCEQQQKSVEAFSDIFGEEPGYGRIARVVLDELVRRIGFRG